MFVGWPSCCQEKLDLRAAGQKHLHVSHCLVRFIDHAKLGKQGTYSQATWHCSPPRFPHNDFRSRWIWVTAAFEIPLSPLPLTAPPDMTSADMMSTLFILRYHSIADHFRQCQVIWLILIGLHIWCHPLSPIWTPLPSVGWLSDSRLRRPRRPRVSRTCRRCCGERVAFPNLSLAEIERG